jgi:hypothetical protein
MNGRSLTPVAVAVAIATLALVEGGAYGAAAIDGANIIAGTVTTTQISNHTIQGRDIAVEAVGRRKLKLGVQKALDVSGPTGPTGPTGATGPALASSYDYATVATGVVYTVAGVGQQQNIEWDTPSSPSSGVTAAGGSSPSLADTFTVADGGVYHVGVGLSPTTTMNATLTIRVNGSSVLQPMDFSPPEASTAGLVTLQAGDSISVTEQGQVPPGTSFGFAGGYLEIFRIA